MLERSLLLFNLNFSRRLESELVTNSEHEYAVVALLVTLVLLEGICQTPSNTKLAYS